MIQKELLYKYFEGRCNPEELKTFLEWLNDGQSDHTILEEIMTDRWEMETSASGGAGTAHGTELKPRLLSALRQKLYPSALNQLLSSIQQASSEGRRPVIAGTIHPETTGTISETFAEPAPAIGQRRRHFKYGVAASVAGVLFLGGWVFNYYRLRSLAPEWRSLTNTSTRVKYCMLPDSTKVWLDPKSILSWSMPVDGQRTVRIEGQAFFDVAKDESRPFLVHSDSIDTKVLGTAFNIESYPDEKEIRVSLVKGKVVVQKEVLHPGEMLTYSKEAHSSRKAPLKMADISDWTSGHLVFSEVPVKTALQRLSRLYRFHLLYQKGIHLDNYRFSTVFTKEETPEQMIKNILFITDCTYKIAGSEVEIIRK